MRIFSLALTGLLVSGIANAKSGCNPPPPCTFEIATGMFAKDEVVIKDYSTEDELERCKFVSKDANAKTRTYLCRGNHKIVLHLTAQDQVAWEGYNNQRKISIYDPVKTKAGTCHDGSRDVSTAGVQARSRYFNYCDLTKSKNKAAPAADHSNDM